MIVEIHARIGNAAFYYAAIMVLWGLWKIYKKQGVDPNYWGALVIAQGIVTLQGVLGATLYFFGDVKLGREIHILYGALSALALPGAYIFTRGKTQRREMIIYGVVFILLALLTARSLRTAGPLMIFE